MEVDRGEESKDNLQGRQKRDQNISVGLDSDFQSPSTQQQKKSVSFQLNHEETDEEKSKQKKKRCLNLFIRTWTPQPTILSTILLFIAFGIIIGVSLIVRCCVPGVRLHNPL